MAIGFVVIVSALLFFTPSYASISGVKGPPSGSGSPHSDTETLVFYDDFNDFDLTKWEHELNMGGGGNWEFQYYTNNRSNSFVEDSILHIKPTLTANKIGEANVQLQSGFTMDMWGSTPASVCTGNQFYGCSRTAGAGGNIINPIQSARLRTSQSFNFKYGRVEIKAKLPRGDWLWPAMWMLPRYNMYGEWPASGEIDICEAKGNAPPYPLGSDVSMSTCHWGPDWTQNGWKHTHGEYHLKSGVFPDSYHVFGLYWTEQEMYSYVDSPENKVMHVTFDQPMWTRGGFDKFPFNNPWKNRPNSAPFDQEFYIVLNLAVGGTSSFFPDGVGGKPWTNSDNHAVNNFYKAKDQWYPTWCPVGKAAETAADPNSCALRIDWVKIYKF